MEAREYFERIVLPIFERLKKDQQAHDLQVAATIVISHTVDYISEREGGKISAVRARILEREPDFEAIYEAANASKHQIVKRENSNHKGLTNPHRTTGSLVTLGGSMPSKLLQAVSAQIVLLDGRTLPLISTLQKVVDVLEQEI
ncbi:hypothetical protein [Microbulbifer sp. S227A]|uniref:hypothetical protein n=1 Tax=Microbulbifer sp. S227A TaxID=3415131 RepID=UPI003C7D2673